MAEPVIDVMVPNYNYARYLEGCVRSVLDQPMEGVRVHIIDNASTDESVAIARRMMANDPRILLTTHEKNLGAQGSFNAAVDHAGARYMMILCADDLLAPHALPEAVRFLDANPDVAFAHGGERKFTDREPAPPPPSDAADYQIQDRPTFLKAACDGEWISAISAIVRTDLQKRAGHFHPDLPYCDDYEMLLRLSTMGKTARTERLHFLRRVHEGQITARYRRSPVPEIMEWVRTFEIHFAGAGAATKDWRKLLDQVRRRYSAQAFRWALKEAVRGDAKLSGELVKTAFSLSPSGIFAAPIEPLRNIARRRALKF